MRLSSFIAGAAFFASSLLATELDPIIYQGTLELMTKAKGAMPLLTLLVSQGSKFFYKSNDTQL